MHTERRLRLRTILGILALAAALAPAEAAWGLNWRAYADRPNDWYSSPEGTRTAANILSYQSDQGDWPKNTNTAAKPYTGERTSLHGTFDNGATVGESRFLARAFRVTGKDLYREAFLRSLDHILAAQYPNGGWPQTSPPGKGYPRYITFNDNTMVNLLELLRDVARSDDFRFVDPKRREAAERAFEWGIACLLKCQLTVDGKLTVWCAQHDEKTLEPRPARTYELISLSGSESAGILLLLMSLDNPSPEVRRAVRAGAQWFDAVKLTGIKQTMVNRNKVIVSDPNAPPLWARFYEIPTNRPFFCGRDGVKKYDIADIEAERRNGYAWYGNWGAKVADAYARWARKWNEPAISS